MKVPATLLILLASQMAAADIASRVAAGKAALSSPEARNYYSAAVGGPFATAAKTCSTHKVPGNWKLTLVGNISAKGALEEIEIEPRNAITNCIAEQLRKSTFLAPPAAIAGKNGFPLQLEVIVTDDTSKPGTQVNVVPVFKQLVSFAMPQGFARGFENSSGPTYILELVPKGETVEKWTQMVTLTGSRDAALIPQLTPSNALQQMAAGFQGQCPTSFAAKPLGNVKVGDYEGFAALMGCGTVQKGEPRSEVAFMIAIKGTSDLYTIQWAERTAATAVAPVLDDTGWKARIQQLQPIRICNPVPNEAAPYPSCINPSAAK